MIDLDKLNALWEAFYEAAADSNAAFEDAVKKGRDATAAQNASDNAAAKTATTLLEIEQALALLVDDGSGSTDGTNGS